MVGSDIKIEKNRQDGYSDALLGNEAAHEVMEHLMDYYIKLNRVICQKLASYARNLPMPIQPPANISMI